MTGEYIDRDVRYMLKEHPDAIILMDGWECSDGARIEYLTARRLGCAIVTEHKILEGADVT